MAAFDPDKTRAKTRENEYGTYAYPFVAPVPFPFPLLLTETSYVCSRAEAGLFPFTEEPLLFYFPHLPSHFHVVFVTPTGRGISYSSEARYKKVVIGRAVLGGLQRRVCW